MLSAEVVINEMSFDRSFEIYEKFRLRRNSLTDMQEYAGNGDVSAITTEIAGSPLMQIKDSTKTMVHGTNRRTACAIFGKTTIRGGRRRVPIL
jgi:hypothetical protein